MVMALNHCSCLSLRRLIRIHCASACNAGWHVVVLHPWDADPIVLCACRVAGNRASCRAASGVFPASDGHKSDRRCAHDAGRRACHASQSTPQVMSM